MEYIEEKNRVYLIDDEKKRVALIDFPEVRSGVVDINHTEVDKSLAGQGIAGILTQKAVEILRKDKRKAILTCSYAIRWFSKHPECEDVLLSPEKEREKTEMVTGPACGIRRK